jgi:hypothetical protein
MNSEKSSTSHRLIASDLDESIGQLDRDRALLTPETNALVMFEKRSSQVCTVSLQFEKIVSMTQSV